MTPQLYKSMINAAAAYAYDGRRPTQRVLVSGGAAWSDHVAVSLFLDCNQEAFEPQLTLCLPCAFDMECGRFSESTSDGRQANALHGEFSRATGIDSLQEIYDALSSGAEAETFDGFHARNNVIAQRSQTLLAFSWGTNGRPDSRGTSYTWDRCNDANVEKIHIGLASLLATRV
jgi:hypothetical protein